MLMQVKNRAKLDNQEGFAAIVIAVVLVLVLSLITVGFAQLMRTEQRSALDKKLSSQAYYAAESGVNDAIKAINAGYDKEKTQCGNTGTALDTTNPKALTPAPHTYLLDNKVGDGAKTEASYPCLLITPNPQDLNYDSVDLFTPQVAEFTARDVSGNAAQVDRVVISWQSQDDNKGFAAANTCTDNAKFLPAGPGAGEWNNAGVDITGLVNFQLFPAPSGAFTRSSLINSMATTYLCPNQAAASAAAGSRSYSSTLLNNSGALLPGNCNTSHLVDHKYACTAEITNIDVLAGQTTFFISMRSIYSKTKVNIKAYSGATQLRLTGAQTVIDSTGKAQDVLRRIQVRVPSTNTFDLAPGSGGGAICKQLETEPGATTSGSPTECPLVP